MYGVQFGMNRKINGSGQALSRLARSAYYLQYALWLVATRAMLSGRGTCGHDLPTLCMLRIPHEDVMTWKNFLHHWPFVKSTGGFPSQRASNTIWPHRPGSKLAQVSLMAPSHNLNRCWLLIKGVLWHSLKSNFTGNAQDVYPWYDFENH